MYVFKPFIAVVLFISAVCPWNATAVGQDKLVTEAILQKSISANFIESLLYKALAEIKQANINGALNTVNELIKTTPNFKLAYAIRGDLLASRARGLNTFGDAGLSDVSQVQDLREEAQIRLESYLAKNKANLFPNLMISLNASQQYVIVVDTSKSRLFLYAKLQNNQLKYMADYYVTIGKNGIDKKAQGDKRTPLGVYFANTKLSGPLPDLYGAAAYPLNYPNEIDTAENRGGSGIWLHGTPTDTYSRPPRASDGCIVLSNPDIKTLHPILQKGNTPVIIASNIDWAPTDVASDYTQEMESLNAAIESWRRDWVSQNTDAYLTHYSKQFFYSDGRLNQWAEYKRIIQERKPKVSINLNDMSVISYPTTQKKMVVVNFEQDFRSPTLQNKMKKRQYWVKENNQWKILYEGAA